MKSPGEAGMDGEMEFAGKASIIVGLGPLKLVLPSRGRLLSRHRVVAEINFAQYTCKLAAEDLYELLPLGREVQLQLQDEEGETAGALVRGTVADIAQEGPRMLFDLRLKKQGEDFEEFLAELRSELPL